MTTAYEHSTTLLSAIIPDRRDLLDKALRHLNPEHFPDQIHRNIFIMLERYGEVTGAILTRAALGDLLAHARADAGKILLYQETYDLLYATQADEAAFRWSLDQIRELTAERATAHALTESMEILTKGAPGERGETLRGHFEARSHALQRFAQIDRDLSMQEAPEGDIRTEGNDILDDYVQREHARTSGRTIGVEFGIPALDAKVNGVSRGELCLIVGSTSDGKTSFCVQTAWNATVRQGLNTVFLTTETVRDQVRRRIISRHSCEEHFAIPGGINSRDLKNGTLSDELKVKLRDVVADFTHNPGYGRCYIIQVPRAATVGYIESKLVRVQRLFSVDLVIMDYLALLKSDRRRQSDREELGSILKEAKQFSTTFNDGVGVPFISPWQVNRTARQEAERTGYYTASATSETSEASNSPDLLIGLLAPWDNDQRVAPIKMQVMKARDGEKANSIEAQVDYATCSFTPRGEHRTESMDALFPGDPLSF